MPDCPKCHRTFSDDKSFCTACGSKLTQTKPVVKTCHKCGCVLTRPVRFCPQCGVPLQVTNSSQSAPVVNQTKVCSSCGAINKQTAIFCSNCNAIFFAAPAPSSARAAVPDPARPAPEPLPLIEPSANPQLVAPFAGTLAPEGLLSQTSCPHCSRLVSAAALHCSHCGASIPEDIKDFALTSFASGRVSPSSALSVGGVSSPLLLPQKLASSEGRERRVLTVWRRALAVLSQNGAITVYNTKDNQIMVKDALPDVLSGVPPVTFDGMLLVPGENGLAIWDLAGRLMNRQLAQGQRSGTISLEGSICSCISSSANHLIAVPVRKSAQEYYVYIYTSDCRYGLKELLKWGPFYSRRQQSSLYVCCSNRFVLAGLPGEQLCAIDVENRQTCGLPFVLSQAQPSGFDLNSGIMALDSQSGDSNIYTISPQAASPEPRLLFSEVGTALRVSQSGEDIYVLCENINGAFVQLNSHGSEQKCQQLGAGMAQWLIAVKDGAFLLMKNGQLHALCNSAGGQRYVGEVKLSGPVPLQQDLLNLSSAPAAVGSSLYIVDNSGALWCFSSGNVSGRG